jgi:putative transcriptional regulator
MASKRNDKNGLPVVDMSKTSKLGISIIQGLREAVLFKRGLLTEADGIKIHRSKKTIDVDVKSIRSDLGLTQEEFATFINASTRAVQHWEQHTRNPDGPTRILLQILAKNPAAVWNTLQ